MGTIHQKNGGIWRRGLIALICLLALICRLDRLAAQPMLGIPKPGPIPNSVQIPLNNCNNTNLKYIVEMSTNLTSWVPFGPFPASPSNIAIVPCTNGFGFYRLLLFPPVGKFLGIICKTNFDMKGQNFRADSFDSSNTNYSTVGQYDVSRCEANAKIVAYIVTNSISLGNGNLFGYVCTTSGRTMNAAVYLGMNGTVGDNTWVRNSANAGTIESGHWTSNFNISMPDVPAPNIIGWATSLPPVTTNNGVVAILLPGGSNYVVSALSIPLLVSGPEPTYMWVKGACSLGVTFTNNGKLILYVGNTTGSTSLAWSGINAINTPGYASNFQIYGLPSLTTLDLHGTYGWVGTLYAPEANAVFGGSGSYPQDTSGAIVVNSVSLKGHWNFHYDEHLAQP